jgi:hypothetical protein
VKLSLLRSVICGISVDFPLPPALNTRIVSPMLSVEELGLEIASLSAHLDAATHRLLSCIRQFDEQCGWYQQGAVSCAYWLAWRVGLDAATAREKVRVARALGKLPAIDGALKAGKLSYAKVRALTRVATPETEAKLLELAMFATGAQLERLCRGYRGALAADNALPPPERSVRRRELPGGMVKLEIVLLPDEADLVLRALDRAREVGHAEGEARPASSAVPGLPDAGGPSPADADVGGLSPSGRGRDLPSRADGMVALAESYLAGNVSTGNGGERFQVMLHVDQDPLAPDGVLAGTLDDGTRVSAETLRPVACDCGLLAQGEHGELSAISIGRRSRSIPPAIRRALRLRDRGCCFPGCTHDRFLHGHHIRHWLHGGETSVDNLALLCTHHHHLIHEGGWSVSRTPDGQLAFTAPDGRALVPVPPRETGEDSLVFLREWAEERGLDLGAGANLPLWDGTRPDYDWAVGAMLTGLSG